MIWIGIKTWIGMNLKVSQALIETLMRVLLMNFVYCGSISFSLVRLKINVVIKINISQENMMKLRLEP